MLSKDDASAIALTLVVVILVIFGAMLTARHIEDRAAYSQSAIQSRVAKYSAGDAVFMKDKFYWACYGRILDYAKVYEGVKYKIRVRCVMRPKPYIFEKEFMENELEISN